MIAHGYIGCDQQTGPGTFYGSGKDGGKKLQVKTVREDLEWTNKVALCTTSDNAVKAMSNQDTWKDMIVNAEKQDTCSVD